MDELCEANVKTVKRANEPMYLECVICGAKQEQKPFQDPDPTMEMIGFLELYQKFLAVHGLCRSKPAVKTPQPQPQPQPLPLRDRVLSITNSYEGACASEQCCILLRAIVRCVRLHDTGLSPLNLDQLISGVIVRMPDDLEQDTIDLICKIRQIQEHNQWHVEKWLRHEHGV
jgi:hypothetical protein